MIRTGITVSALEKEDEAVITTMIDLLTEQARPEGAIDPEDPETLPEQWRK